MENCKSSSLPVRHKVAMANKSPVKIEISIMHLLVLLNIIKLKRKEFVVKFFLFVFCCLFLHFLFPVSLSLDFPSQCIPPKT